MKEMELFELLTDIDDAYITEVDALRPQRRRKTALRLVLLAALLPIIVVCAVASARSRAELTVTATDDGYSVLFRSTDDWPTEWTDWYPQSLPEGYTEKRVSSDESYCRNIVFLNGKYSALTLTYGLPRYLPAYSVAGEQAENVQVGKYQALHFTAVTEQTLYLDGALALTPVYHDWLFWVDGENKLGFVLQAVSLTQLDLQAVAQSIARVDTLPSGGQPDADAAMVKLGDYNPQWLPEGYRHVATYGTPAYPLTSRWYSGYVHKRYRNADYYELHLFYEFIAQGQTSCAGVIDDTLLPEAITVGGYDAVYYETPWGAPYAVVWSREDVAGVPLTFTLYADAIAGAQSISRDELLRIAEGITMTTAANTTHFVTYGGHE